MEGHTRVRLVPLSASIEVALVLLIAGSGTAHAASTVQLAYIDPGTGSLIIQIVVASLAAAAVTTRAYWTKIKGWLGMGSAEAADDGDLRPGANPETPPDDG